MKNLNIKKSFIPLALAGTLTATSLTGCNVSKVGKIVECNIEDNHIHKYVSEEGFETYKEGEYDENNGMFRTEETTVPNENLKTLSNFDLIKIADNLKALETATKNDLPYTEYEYTYTYYVPIRSGKVTISSPRTGTNFTTDSQHSNLTGKIRDVEYRYKVYKIGQDKKGNTIIIESALVTDLTDIMDEYPYFKLSDYKQKVYSKKREIQKELVK